MTPRGLVMCSATPDEPHPATGTRTSRCRFHQDEYRKQMKHYNALVSRFRKREGADPGDKAAWEGNIRYTRLGNRWTVLSAEQRRELRAALIAQSYAIGSLRALRSEGNVAHMTASAIVEIVNNALEAQRVTTRLVEEIAREPET